MSRFNHKEREYFKALGLDSTLDNKVESIIQDTEDGEYELDSEITQAVLDLGLNIVESSAICFKIGEVIGKMRGGKTLKEAIKS